MQQDSGMLKAVSHVHLYFVKRSMSESVAMLSGVASPKIWVGQKFWGAKMFDFRRITLFCMEKRFSKHKIYIFQKFWGSMAPLGYAYGNASTSLKNPLLLRV